MEDRAGGIWVSSEYTGISRLSVLNEGAERIFPEDETLSDRSNTVRMINRMPDDKIWLGTRRGGLYIYDPHLKTIESSRYFDSNNLFSIFDFRIDFTFVLVHGCLLLMACLIVYSIYFILIL